MRWINVDGLNWDVLQLLATQYNLHPLACEDVLHVPQRTKADFYGARSSKASAVAFNTPLQDPAIASSDRGSCYSGFPVP